MIGLGLLGAVLRIALRATGVIAVESEPPVGPPCDSRAHRTPHTAEPGPVWGGWLAADVGQSEPDGTETGLHHVGWHHSPREVEAERERHAEERRIMGEPW